MSQFAPSAPPAVRSQTVAVTVPEGLRSGDELNVQTEDGRLFNIVIPPGAKNLYCASDVLID